MSVPGRSLNVGGASVQVFADSASACQGAADLIARTVHAALAERGHAVLGLATGSTPIPVYARLVEMYQENRISFEKVHTFNLDEYYPISPLDANSYRTYMYRHLFSHVNLPPNRAHVLDGTVPVEFAEEHAKEFDHWIEASGGLDLQLLGIGRNGHIGFNEPSSMPVDQALAQPTRMVELHPVTRADAASGFGGDLARVPTHALTVGTLPILSARSVLILAFGSGKADAVARSLTGPMTSEVPASLLQAVPGKVTWLIDELAAQGLA